MIDTQHTTTSTPVIRVALPSDARPITEIYIASWNAGFVGLMPHRRVHDDLVARWRGDLSLPLPHRWWVAEIDGTIAGFVGTCPSRDPIEAGLGELNTIAVDPRWCRQGIGRALMAEAVPALVADGYREAILWTLAHYERGQRFYESTGWHLDGGTREDGQQVRYRRRLRDRS